MLSWNRCTPGPGPSSFVAVRKGGLVPARGRSQVCLVVQVLHFYVTHHHGATACHAAALLLDFEGRVRVQVLLACGDGLGASAITQYRYTAQQAEQTSGSRGVTTELQTFFIEGVTYRCG
jgi:hypothetical protein